ncbi:hypothetical protein VEE59_44280 [Escherichia coli]|nr:hypothetical protein VEE59_44280 [Escherichia coli]
MRWATKPVEIIAFVGRIRRLRRIRHLSMMPDAALVASYQAYDFLRIRHKQRVSAKQPNHRGTQHGSNGSLRCVAVNCATRYQINY